MLRSFPDKIGWSTGASKDAVKDFELPLDVVVSGAMANQVQPLCQ
jgi:hypothetical protein